MSRVRPWGCPSRCRTAARLRRACATFLRSWRPSLAPGCAAHTDLSLWAQQGVLLLNTVLTVEQGAANAHAGRGWETFTRAALEYAAAHGTAPLAAVLWGKPAQKYAPIFNRLPPTARCWCWNPPTPARCRPTAGSSARRRSAR